MSNYFGIGDSTMSHALISSEDELHESIPTPKQKQQHRRRKSLKSKALQMRRRKIAGNGNDSSDEQAGNEEDGADNGDEDESEDGENTVLAPSGAVKRSSRLKMKMKRRSLNNPTRQAGLKLTTSGSPKAKKPRSILAHSRTRSSEKVRFDLENLTSYADDLPTGADAEDATIEDVDLSSASDDDVYETLNFISDSDEDDEKIEEIEADLLIQHLEETGEIAEIDQAHSEPWIEAILEEAIKIERVDREALNIAPDFGIDFFAQAEADEPLDTDIVASIEIDAMSVPFPAFHDASVPASDFETGLHTPSSSCMPPVKYDDEETEEEDADTRIINQQKIWQRKKNATANRVRKNSKPKTPKRGSWNIPKGTMIIRHNDQNELVVTKHGKLMDTGTITPKGLVKKGSIPATPILGLDSQDIFNPVTMPSSAQSSPIMGRGESAFFSDAVSYPFIPNLDNLDNLAKSPSLAEFVKDVL